MAVVRNVFNNQTEYQNFLIAFHLQEFIGFILIKTNNNKIKIKKVGVVVFYTCHYEIFMQFLLV